MAIVSSTHVAGQAQVDGRRYVRETHTDQYGVTYTAEYLAAVDADLVAIRAARALVIYQGLVDRETAAMLTLGAALTLQYAAKTDLVTAYREQFRAATRDEAARLAKWLLDHIDAGDFTDAQVRTAFGLGAAAYTALKTRMGTMRTAYDSVQSSQGE